MCWSSRGHDSGGVRNGHREQSSSQTFEHRARTVRLWRCCHEDQPRNAVAPQLHCRIPKARQQVVERRRLPLLLPHRPPGRALRGSWQRCAPRRCERGGGRERGGAAAGRPHFAAARRYSAAIDQRALGQRARLTRWFGGPEPGGPCASASACSFNRTLFLAGFADPAPFTQGRLLNMFEVGLPPGETPPFAEVGSGAEVRSGVEVGSGAEVGSGV